MSYFPLPREIRLQQWEPTIADLSEENTMDLLSWSHAKEEDGYPDQKRQLTQNGKNKPDK